MLSNTLNTNEVKNASGTEIEFQHLDGVGRKRIFAKIGENPSLQHRLSISHAETGLGLKLVRRSAVRFDYQVLSERDLVTPVTCSFYTVGVIPVGHLTAYTAPTLCAANLMSFLCTTGAGTTVLFDGTGNGMAAILNGSL